MKKYFLAVMTLFSLWITPSYAFFGGVSSFFSGVSDIASGFTSAVSSIGSAVGSVFSLVDSFTGYDGGYSFGGYESTYMPGTSVDYSRSGVPYAVNTGAVVPGSGVVLIQDFDSLFESISGGEGVTPTGKFELPDPDKFNRIGENTSLRGFILNVLNFTLTFLGLVAVAMVIYAGYLYVVSLGDDGNMEKAKKIIIYGVIGILVVLVSFALVNTIIKHAGKGTRDNINDPDNVQPMDPNASTIIQNNNGSGVIINQNGTVIPLSTTTGGTTAGGTANPLNTFYTSNLITVSGDGIKDFGNVVVVTPEAARNGIQFGIGVKGFAVFDLGNGIQLPLDTTNNPSATITHYFSDEGRYNIRAIIRTPDGKQLTAQKSVVVGGTKAFFTAPRYILLQGEPITLDASGSRVSVGAIKSYTWKCANNNGGTEGCFGEVFGKRPTVSFSAPGEYTVTLEVESIAGTKDTYERTFTVYGEKPVASFRYESTENPQKPAEYRFIAVDSKNLRGTNEGLMYFWNFDGDLKQANTPEVIYTFKTKGTKKVSLVVVDNFQGKAIKSDPVEQTVTVETTLPAVFNVTPGTNP